MLVRGHACWHCAGESDPCGQSIHYLGLKHKVVDKVKLAKQGTAMPVGGGRQRGSCLEEGLDDQWVAVQRGKVESCVPAVPAPRAHLSPPA